MKKIFLFCVALFLITIPQKIFACGNEYYTPELPLAEGKLNLDEILNSKYDLIYPYWSSMRGFNLYTHWDSLYRVIFNSKKVSSKTKASWHQIEDALTRKVDFRLLSDFAWYELKLYDKSIAVKLLEALYKEHPNEYNVVANLGTAYEVTGNNAKALELLKKAVALNPSSHYGSEWIHIRILEQKLSPNPDYSLIINLGADDIKHWLNNKHYKFPQSPDSLLKQIAYQLHERIFFVLPPDKIVGQLIFDFANIVAKNYGLTEADKFYKYAQVYDAALINKTPSSYSSEKSSADSLANDHALFDAVRNNHTLIVPAILIIFTPFVFFFFKKYLLRKK